jgi:phytoene dehydrogenase-like protein
MCDLITGGQVEWTPMPDPFEVFMYPGFRFEVPSDPARYQAALAERFPDESKAIGRYFRDTRKAGAGLAMMMMRGNASALFRAIGFAARCCLRPDPRVSTKAYLDAHFESPQLKALLATQWGCYGLPPGRSPFLLHSLIVNYYLHGGSFPVGGAGRIAAAVRAVVEERGGRFLPGREVTEVVVRDGRAVGVKVRKAHGRGAGEVEEYFAPAIVSNAGAVATYTRLIPPEHPVPFKADLMRFVEAHRPPSNVTLFIGFSRDPRELSVKGEHYWMYRGLDHDQAFEGTGEWLRGGDPTHAFLSFPSLKDPEADGHTAEVLAFTDYEFFARWRDQPWRKRDDEYQRLKERLADSLVAFVDQHVPGLAGMVEHREVGTPLTNEHFTGHHRGAAYGLPSETERFLPENAAWTHPRTPIPGLYMAGADTAGLGVNGAMMGGISCCGHLPDGLSMAGIMRAASRHR